MNKFESKKDLTAFFEFYNEDGTNNHKGFDRVQRILSLSWNIHPHSLNPHRHFSKDAYQTIIHNNYKIFYFQQKTRTSYNDG